MKTKKLLVHLENFEIGFHDFVLNELRISEAVQLKRLFEGFKVQFVDKALGLSNPLDNRNEVNHFNKETALQLDPIATYIGLLKDTGLRKEQIQILQKLEAATTNVQKGNN
ncbi:MAG: hypothetical protein AAGB24_13595 [Bacteroidota bacterium]